jgi:hypothetical protein
MNLTEQQARALDHARDLLAEDDTHDIMLHPDWHRMCRLALRDILDAFDEEAGAGDDTELHQRRPAKDACAPGECTCGATVTHDGTVIPAAAS